MRRSVAADFFLCALLAAATLALYRTILGLWWTYDDAFHLRQAFTHSFEAILGDGSFWEQLPNPVFTPLLFISLKFDLAQFGFDARLHYIHHLVLIAVVPLAVYLLCRLWVGPARSFAAALLMLCGPPMCEIAAQLGHRHYVEGLILSLLSVALFILALRKEKWVWSFASAVLYFAAMAEKEVYVPLPLIAAAMPETTARARVRYLMPHAVALAVYAVWRTSMLGLGLTGYGLTTTRDAWRNALLTLPWRILRRIGGHEAILGGSFLFALGVIVVLVVVRHRRSRLLAIAAVIAAVAPIVPVSTQIETRYVLISWTLAAIACAFLAEKARWNVAALVVVIALALAANRAEWAATLRVVNRMSQEGRFFARMRGDAILLNPSIPPAAFGELAWIKQRVNAPAGGRGLYDDLPLCADLGSNVPVYGYLEPAGRVEPVKRSLVQRTTCRNIRELPLSVRFSYRDGVLYWELGPHRDGRYRFILGNGSQGFDVGREAGFRLPNVPGVTLRVRYESPAGWITYSPELTLDFARQPDVTWQR